MYRSDICTVPISIAGIPAISIPAGFIGELPIGMQIIAKPFGEEILINVAFASAQSTDWP